MQPLDERRRRRRRHRLSRPDHADAERLRHRGRADAGRTSTPRPRPPAPRTPSRPATSWSRPRWPPELDSDVDLWVQAPGDVPVGYSNKGGAVFNLLRDDLGHAARRLRPQLRESATPAASSPASTRSTCISTATGAVQPPVPVTVVVSIKPRGRGPDAPDPADARSTLAREGAGADRVPLPARPRAAQVVPGSVNSLQRPLRSGVKS